MVKLIAFDLDGTTLDDNKSISKYNIDALCKASEKGIILVPSTGRLKTFLPTVLTDLPFIKYAITTNGGGVYNLETDECLHSALISTEKALLVHNLVEKYNAYGEYYISGIACSTPGNIDFKMKKFAIPEEKRYFLGKQYEIVENMTEFLSCEENKLEKIYIPYIEKETKTKLSDELMKLGDLFLTASIPNSLEINDINATKGNALEKLCKILGIKQEETMSIGDSGNDTEMLKWAGISVAMDNAEDEVKSHAKYTTDRYDNDGFGKAVYKFALKD